MLKLSSLLLAVVLTAAAAEDAPLIQADFEGPGSGFTIAAEGSLSAAPEAVLAGKQSLRIDSMGSTSDWHEVINTDSKNPVVFLLWGQRAWAHASHVDTPLLLTTIPDRFRHRTVVVLALRRI